MYSTPLSEGKPTRENFPKYIETTDRQVFMIEAVFGQLLALDGKVIKYYNYETEKFFDPTHKVLELQPLSPKIYKPRIWSRGLKS